MDLNLTSTKKLVVEAVQSSTSEMDTVSFNLPDTCVNILFDHLPLEDLLHCNLVCSQWNRLYRAACSRRRKLTLIIGDAGNTRSKNPYHWVSSYSFSSHPFANWDDKLSPIRHSWLMRMNTKLALVAGIMHNLANITTLEIIFYETKFEALDHIIELLHFWAEKLVSLKLWPGFEMYDETLSHSADLRLFDAINSLTRLTHLTLTYTTDSLYTKDANNKPIMRIQLENLQEFNLDCDPNPGDGCKAIHRYAQSHPNLRVGFNLWFIETKHWDLLFSYSPQVASRVTQLCLNHLITKPLLTRVCGHFTNLTTLQLESRTLPAAQWTKAIAQCSQLVHLRLVLNLRSPEECPDLRTHPTKAQITQLKCIKMLSIRLTSHSHDDLKTLQFTWIFPNLQMISINNLDLNCNICRTVDRFDILHYDVTLDFDTKCHLSKCRKLLLSPLKEFAHLSVIRYYPSDCGTVLYSKEEL